MQLQSACSVGNEKFNGSTKDVFNSGRCQRSIEQGVTAFGVIEQFIFGPIVVRWVVYDKEKEKTSKNFLLNTLFEMCSSAEH